MNPSEAPGEPFPARDSLAKTAAAAFGIFCAASLLLYAALINDDWIDFYFHIRQGERFANGELPYRDFMIAPWPGVPVLLGLWFKIFGLSMFGVHVLQAMLGGLSAALSWLIARRHAGPWTVWIAPAGALASYVLGNEGISHMAFAMPFALLALWAALWADGAQRARGWFAAGACAALAGVCTQSVGIWLGLLLVVCALTGEKGGRLKAAAATVAGAAPMVGAMLVWIWSYGAWESFMYASYYWARERYVPFHAGVGWGSWRPPWSMLAQVPGGWWLAWVPALSVVWVSVFVLPALPLYSAARGWLKKAEPPPRRILALACVAMVLAAYPHIGAMRWSRLVAPFWILLAVELHHLLRGPQPSETGAAVRGLSAGLCGFLLLIVPLQWSYRGQLVELETPRGTVLVREAAVDEYRVLSKRFKPGDRVMMLPERGASGVLLGLKNPTAYEILVPVISSPRQLSEAVDQLRSAGYPPVAIMTAREYADIEKVMKTYGPAKYLEEFEHNPMNDFLAAHYEAEFQEGPVIVLRRKEPPAPASAP
ncbi:MAG: glycosyltransferase family 39 protein [Planctomycetota bacterium]|nr:glycosyltransferase family 39 protein [Planctomycetota bacterium]